MLICLFKWAIKLLLLNKLKHPNKPKKDNKIKTIIITPNVSIEKLSPSIPKEPIPLKNSLMNPDTLWL
jgi:hypothetical protein